MVFIPSAVNIIGRALGVPLAPSPAALVRLVMFSVLLPLALGMSVRTATPLAAARVHRPVMLIALARLAVNVITVLIAIFLMRQTDREEGCGSVLTSSCSD